MRGMGYRLNHHATGARRWVRLPVVASGDSIKTLTATESFKVYRVHNNMRK
jgi:hypothetical protein